MELRLHRLLKEIELLLHWSNESVLLAVRYQPVISHKIKLVRQYRQALGV